MKNRFRSALRDDIQFLFEEEELDGPVDDD
jgi:hypothetical protein